MVPEGKDAVAESAMEPTTCWVIVRSAPADSGTVDMSHAAEREKGWGMMEDIVSGRRGFACS